MAVECERKFLVVGDDWRAGAPGVSIRQGYVAETGRTAVRVRIAGDVAFLTVKSGKDGMIRVEYEYAIPIEDAAEMLDRVCAGPLIEKVRYGVRFEGFGWDVDEFLGDNAGLVVAEIELDSPEQQPPLPPWVGREVTHDARYLNVNLARRPYREWPAER